MAERRERRQDRLSLSAPDRRQLALCLTLHNFRVALDNIFALLIVVALCTFILDIIIGFPVTLVLVLDLIVVSWFLGSYLYLLSLLPRAAHGLTS